MRSRTERRRAAIVDPDGPAEMARLNGVLKTRLAEAPYLAGEDCSRADIATFPRVFAMEERKLFDIAEKRRRAGGASTASHADDTHDPVAVSIGLCDDAVSHVTKVAADAAPCVSAAAFLTARSTRMADERKSFDALLKEAPHAAATVSLVGTLAQSKEPGKFVLTMQDGRSITLDTAAVKGHEVMGTSVGQTMVRVEVDSANLPAGAQGGAAPASPYSPSAFTLPSVDQFHTLPRADDTVTYLDMPHTYPGYDLHTLPIFDLGPFGTGFADQTGTIAEGIPDPYGPGGPYAAGGAAPFALATQQQAPQGAVAALQMPHMPVTGFVDIHTGYFDQHHTGVHDLHTVPYVDAGATGRPPYLD